MGARESVTRFILGQPSGSTSLQKGAPPADEFKTFLDTTIRRGGVAAQHAQVLRDGLDRAVNDQQLYGPMASMIEKASSTGGLVGINDYGIKGRRQYAAERRRLLDLYSIVMNNGDVRTATLHLRNEIFRRGLEWEPAFEFKCDRCDKEYSARGAKRIKFSCHCAEEEGLYVDEDGRSIEMEVEEGSSEKRGYPLRRPSPHEISKFDKFLDHANYFGQSLESILRQCEDDINVVDDGFIYFRCKYELADHEIERAAKDPFNPEFSPDREVMQIFRLDPTLMEFDMDDRGIPGQAHHLCIFHRDSLMDVPMGEGWDVEWKGICVTCGLRTYPVYYKYSEQQASAYGPGRAKELYLIEDEVIHWSRYSPTETYGFPPVLSVYEKAMTLIGMDRYLYDYFYERRVPQGVVTVVTDDTAAFNATKNEVEARMQQDPHYIPWMAIASKSGQGRMEFVRFAYSLDELDYLPVRDEIRERISGIYGVSQIWMQSTEGVGGLNNESQQLTVMSRVVEGAQRSYHTDVFPKLQRILKIGDWHLKIRTPEETSELVEIQIMQAKASVAQTMQGMGFGIDYDSETEEFSYNGRVLSMEDQAKAQTEASSPFGGGTPPGGGGMAPPGGGGMAPPQQGMAQSQQGMAQLGQGVQQPLPQEQLDPQQPAKGQAQMAEQSREIPDPYGR